MNIGDRYIRYEDGSFFKIDRIRGVNVWMAKDPPQDGPEGQGVVVKQSDLQNPWLWAPAPAE